MNLSNHDLDSLIEKSLAERDKRCWNCIDSGNYTSPNQKELKLISSGNLPGAMSEYQERTGELEYFTFRVFGCIGRKENPLSEM